METVLVSYRKQLPASTLRPLPSSCHIILLPSGARYELRLAQDISIFIMVELN